MRALLESGWSEREEIEKYRKVASSNTSHVESHAGFFRLLMKRIFDPYVLCPFDKKLISKLVKRVRIRDYISICTSTAPALHCITDPII